MQINPAQNPSSSLPLKTFPRTRTINGKRKVAAENADEMAMLNPIAEAPATAPPHHHLTWVGREAIIDCGASAPVIGPKIEKKLEVWKRRNRVSVSQGDGTKLKGGKFVANTTFSIPSISLIPQQSGQPSSNQPRQAQNQHRYQAKIQPCHCNQILHSHPA